MINETFTASNGITITPDPYGTYWKSDYGSSTLDYPIDSGVDDALAEWYQYRRDQELGRWRDTIIPSFVIYPNGDDCIRVFSETTGIFWDANRPLRLEGIDEISWLGAAARYFEQHPEPEPEWHDAQPGEVWLLTIDGKEHPAQTITGRIAIYPHDADPEFFIPTLTPANTIGDIWEHTWSPTDHRITAGRRIWPEPEETDDE